MNLYRKINNITGWIVFAIAAYTYLSTIEPTGSFWDCGEFIATANKLEVGHPPGAPLFMLMGRIFILFAGNNVRMIPIMVNAMSALLSAFTILFLFWTITHLARKIVIKGQDYTMPQIIGIVGAGAVGALCYTFSDSFWFSAVEGEVYASSSFFTAIVFWAMLKWENVANEKHSARWLILIAYLMGLSIGVHLLNLLTIPALAFVYYFKKYPVTRKGIIYTSVISVIILGAIQFGIITGIIALAGDFELFFVNSLGLPFNSGILFYSALIIAAVIICLRHSLKPSPTLYKAVLGIIGLILLFSLSNSADAGDVIVKLIIGAAILGTAYFLRTEYSLINTIILCFTFIVIGYSSFGLVLVRSAANPPMDENNPENIFNFFSYLNREQYGDRPLFYGQYYTARVIDQKDGSATYTRVPGDKKYRFTGYRPIAVYESSQQTILPRMYSNQPSHVSEYKKWAGVKGDRKPTFIENMQFLIVYQLGEMYWRYFMWNFAGRQNDLQGPGGITKGNWESGIKFIDAIRLGPQDKLPESMLKNRGRNHYFFFPFILGIIGLIFQFTRQKHDGWVVLLLFFFTGIAIVLYLNGPPLQPRERDYAYVGSFYAFAIWVGLGVLSLTEAARKKMPGVAAPIGITLICLLAVPYVMAKENWDDHDRSHRFTSRDFAYDYLNSCAPNAILFTNGDNDTFPLWYAQEVENIRTDVRVVNLSLLNTDWYIDQLKRKAYDSDAVPFSLTFDQYMQGTRDYIPYVNKKLSGALELSDLMKFISSEDPRAKVGGGDRELLNYFPTKHLKITIDKKQILATGTVAAEDSSKIVDAITWTLPESQNYLMKNDIMILDLLANNRWKRPVYFATTVGSENFLNMDDYFQLEGLAYRFVPIKAVKEEESFRGSVNVDIMYDNVMNKFLWGNMKDKRVYLDENNLRMTTNMRLNTVRLTQTLLDAGKNDSAKAVLDKCMEEMPDYNVPYNIFMTRVAQQYLSIAGNMSDSIGISSSDMELNKRRQCLDEGMRIVRRLAEIYQDNLNYYLSLKGTDYYKSVEPEVGQALYVLQLLPTMVRNTGQVQLSDSLGKNFMKLRNQAGYE
jgi:hypothetical protein